MKTACKTQCKQCPFRPNALRGWLGDYTSSSIFNSIWRNIPFFCHTKIDYEDESWLAKAQVNGKVRLGSLAFANKMMSPTRPDAYPETDAEVLVLRAANKDRTDIQCMAPREFMTHHQSANTSNP